MWITLPMTLNGPLTRGLTKFTLSSRVDCSVLVLTLITARPHVVSSAAMITPPCTCGLPRLPDAMWLNGNVSSAYPPPTSTLVTLKPSSE